MRDTKAETQELALKHIHLAYKIAWEYHGCGTEREELQAAALFRLVKAAAGFDRSRKVPFPAFASAVIRNTLRMEFRKAEKDRRCVSMEEAAAGSAEEGNIRTWADRIACRETGFDQAEEEDFLPSLLFESGLTGKERKAVWLVICSGMTQKEAGEQIGLSQPHVSRRVRSGMKKIRKKYMEIMYPAETSQRMLSGEQRGNRQHVKQDL